MQAPNEAQAAILYRAGMIADTAAKRISTLSDEQQAEAAGRGWSAVARIIDTLVALVPDELDREWVEDSLLNGSLQLDDLVGTLKQLAEADKPPVKKARAARV